MQVAPQTQWQCLGCKALYASEKNVKLHVNYHFQVRLAAGAQAGGPARLGLAGGLGVKFKA